MSASTVSTLAHDLRGPVVTIEGFQGEIGHALDELERLLSDDKCELSEDMASRLESLLGEDLRPCLAFASRAVTMLHERIDGLDTLADPLKDASDEK